MPKELGGNGARGTNPEQMFAAGYSACFLSALKFVAGQERQPLPADTSITGTVGRGKIATGFSIEVDLAISMPGMSAMSMPMSTIVRTARGRRAGSGAAIPSRVASVPRA